MTRIEFLLKRLITNVQQSSICSLKLVVFTVKLVFQHLKMSRQQPLENQISMEEKSPLLPKFYNKDVVEMFYIVGTIIFVILVMIILGVIIALTLIWDRCENSPTSTTIPSTTNTAPTSTKHNRNGHLCEM